MFESAEKPHGGKNPTRHLEPLVRLLRIVAVSRDQLLLALLSNKLADLQSASKPAAR
jgi:hypothetical protein